MMSHPEASTVLTRMEARLCETRHNLFELERSLRDRAEAATIGSRPKARRYNRRMSTWSRLPMKKPIAEFLDDLIDNAAADLDRLRRTSRLQLL